MTDDRDPELQALFASAEEDLPGEAFAAGVMAGTRRVNRWKILVRVAAALAVIVCAWIVYLPAQDAVSLMMHGLTAPLIAVQNPLISQLLLPLNSAAFPIALAWLVLRRVRRRLFS